MTPAGCMRLTTVLLALALPRLAARAATDDTCTGKGWAHNTRNILPDIAFLPHLTDAAACCSACAAHTGCAAWTANATGCGLKKASWEKGGCPNSTSGVVSVGPKPSPAPSPPVPTPPLPPSPPEPPGACKLTESGPITVTQHGESIENLRIFTTTKQPAIFIQGKTGVTIRNCTITHRAQQTWPYGNGIYFTGADGLTIENVEVQLVGVEKGPLPDLHNYNINGISSTGVRISNVRVVGGSTGIELTHCDGAHVSNLVALNMRGPYPRGQCFQTSFSDNVVLENFYCKNDNTSWTEDNLSLYRSSNVTVRRGLIDGNNSPTGVGVMFEQDDPTKHDGLCEDVDVIHMGDGCFSAYGGTNIRFVRARCKDNHCAGWAGRDKPTSGSLMYYAGDENGQNSTGIRLEQSVYSGACAPNHVLGSRDPSAWVQTDLQKQEFALQDPVNVTFCWE
eukprot:SAG31_NODE_1816_length_7206_cov_3.636133_1_plen_450_part_00